MGNGKHDLPILHASKEALLLFLVISCSYSHSTAWHRHIHRCKLLSVCALQTSQTETVNSTVFYCSSSVRLCRFLLSLFLFSEVKSLQTEKRRCTYTRSKVSGAKVESTLVTVGSPKVNSCGQITVYRPTLHLSFFFLCLSCFFCLSYCCVHLSYV